MARQPIFDRKNEIFGYELLYRSGMADCSAVTDGDRATLELIRNSFTLIGINTLTNGKMAFINFTQNLLQSHLLKVFSPEVVAVEIIEDVVVTPEVTAACEGLKDRGFLIALDDYDGKNGHHSLLDLASIVKIDFCKTDRADRAAMVREIGYGRVKFLAEKVESYEEYREACELGFTYFQGYFFSKPVVVSGRNITEQKVACFRILQELYRPEVDYDELEKIFRYDMGLSYKLLHLVNSAAFGLRRPVKSIRQALVLLGINDLKKWGALVTLQGVCVDKPNELVITSLVRAKICEALAPLVQMGQYGSELFLLGMFSLIDIMMNRPMIDVLQELPLEPEICRALLREPGRFRKILDLVLCYEAGAWDVFRQNCRELGVKEETFAQIYLQALTSVKRYFG